MSSIRNILLGFTLLGNSFAEVNFSEEVQPILNKHCTACHGGVKEAGDISFIYRESVLGVGKSGKHVIIPGDPDGSEMMIRILHDDPDEIMPKPEHGPPLSEEEVSVVRQWIQEGAKWGEHWSFVAPKKHPLPTVTKKEWTRRPLDHFVLARLESKKLSPSPEADKAALLRRVSLDLTGLPPTVAELDAFLNDSAPDAYEQQVDRLLASPHFGERWASVWMDLARYADSEGLGMDRPRVIWKYRDWVVDAFNKDHPFDEFTIDQLAGDLIPDATLEQKIATGFHRLTQLNQEGGTDDEEFRVAAVMDRITTTGEVWQGLTLGCVQCHSHPYDPLQHEEYFELMEFFNQTADADLTEDLPKLAVPLDKKDYPKANSLQNQITAAKQKLFERWQMIHQETAWQPAKITKAESAKAKLEIVRQDEHFEYRADPNAKAGATYTLELETKLEEITALRLTFLPIDEEKALHTPEWGALLQKFTLQLADPENRKTDIPLAEILADEPHPLFNPSGSLRNSSRAWGTYSKTFRARHATIVLKEPLEIPENSRLIATINNGQSILSSFPMVSKRGRLALTDNPDWITSRQNEEIRQWKSQIGKAKQQLKKIRTTTVPVMQERHQSHFRHTHTFLRGNWIDKGDRIEKADTPNVFPPLKPQSDRPDRLDLARWIASTENPLTSRVAANRFWLELFGVGIVGTPEDFGSAGEKPSHPKLLDYLAIQFSQEMDWSVKSLLREIATSATYRQSATVPESLAKSDPSNRLLARGPRQRLTAEMTRDHALVAAGLLSPKLGGPPVHPPIPKGVWTPFQGNDKWKTPEEGSAQRYRRSLYTYWKRSIPYPTFVTFDAPTRERCSNRRLVSNTPLQALTTLNDAAFHECAQNLGAIMKEHAEGDLDRALTHGYRIATSRAINPARLSEIRGLFQNTKEEYAKHPEESKKLAGDPEAAAYTIIASVLLNLDEALTR